MTKFLVQDLTDLGGPINIAAEIDGERFPIFTHCPKRHADDTVDRRKAADAIAQLLNTLPLANVAELLNNA